MSPISSETCVQINPQHANHVDANILENLIKPQFDGVVMLSSSGVFFNDAQPRPDGKKIYHIFEQVSCEDPEDEKPVLNDLDLKTELFSKASEDNIKNIQQVLEENGIPLDEWCPPITREVDAEGNPFNNSSQSRHFIQSFTENSQVPLDEKPIAIFNKAFIEFGIMKDKISLQTKRTFDCKFGKAKPGSKREVNTEEIFYYCQLCSFFTKYKGNLKSHEFNVHKTKRLEKKEKIVCFKRKYSSNVHKLKEEKALKSLKTKTNKDNVGSTKKKILETLRQNLKKTARFNRRKDKKSPSKSSLLKNKPLVKMINRKKLKCSPNRVKKKLQQKVRRNVNLRIKQSIFRNCRKKLNKDFTKEDNVVPDEIEKKHEDRKETKPEPNCSSEEKRVEPKGILEMIKNFRMERVPNKIDFKVEKNSSYEEIDSLTVETCTGRLCDKKDVAIKTDFKVEKNNGSVKCSISPPLERSEKTRNIHEERELSYITPEILNKKALSEKTDLSDKISKEIEETNSNLPSTLETLSITKNINEESELTNITSELLNKEALSQKTDLSDKIGKEIAETNSNLPSNLETFTKTENIHEESELTNITSEILNKKALSEKTDLSDKIGKEIEETNSNLPSTLKTYSKMENIHEEIELRNISLEVLHDKKDDGAKFDFEMKENNDSVVFNTPPALEKCTSDQRNYSPGIIDNCNAITKNIGFKVRENGSANFDIRPKVCDMIKNCNQAQSDIERIILGLQTKTPVVLIKNLSGASIPKNYGCIMKTDSNKNDENKATEENVPKKMNGLSKVISCSGKIIKKSKENIECKMKSEREDYVGIDCYENIKENISVNSGQIKSERKDSVAKENIPKDICVSRSLRVLISDDVSNSLLKNFSESIKLRENEGPGVCIEMDGKIKHYCPYCQFSTDYKYSVARHMMKYCKRRSTKKYKIGRSPLLTSSNNNPQLKFNIYKCSSCSFASRSKDSLNTHQLIHSKRIFVNCNQCDYITNNKGFLERHTNINHNAIESERKLTVKLEKLSDINLRDHTSPKSSDWTSSEKQLLEPEKRVIISDKLRCLNCSYVTRSKRQFEEHSSVHLINQFACKLCSYHTKLRLQLREHMKSHKKSPKSLIFKSRAKLARSLRSNAKLKVRCPYCSYFTASEENLNRHKALHTPHKKIVNRGKLRFRKAHKAHDRKNVSRRLLQVYTCSNCPRAFRSQELLKSHLRTHGKQMTAVDPELTLRRFRGPARFRLNITPRSMLNPVSNYRCTTCDYIATTRHLLAQHNLIHLNTRLLKCEHCDYETNYKGNLVKHVLIHLEEYIIN